LVDEKKVQFVLSGSSSRKLRRDPQQNLLPGRVVHFHLDPLTMDEFPINDLEEEFLYGSLPGIKNTFAIQDKEKELISYVEIYLEEEIRNEALVRNVPAFGRFLELAALESGQIINMRNISREIGIAHSTVSDYYQILEDTLIAERIEPFTKGSLRKKLTKSPKYLFFDLGVARVASREPPSLTMDVRGKSFESFVGLQILRLIRNKVPRVKLSFWRDPDGPEVDWVIMKGKEIIPIEVKYTKNPIQKHFNHLKTFLKEYPQAKKAYVVCLIDEVQKWDSDCYAIPYTDLSNIIS
jgi:predicted AAA+ superfamily ATPase